MTSFKPEVIRNPVEDVLAAMRKHSTKPEHFLCGLRPVNCLVVLEHIDELERQVAVKQQAK